jgi:hypothetical protein
MAQGAPNSSLRSRVTVNDYDDPSTQLAEVLDRSLH